MSRKKRKKEKEYTDAHFYKYPRRLMGIELHRAMMDDVIGELDLLADDRETVIGTLFILQKLGEHIFWCWDPKLETVALVRLGKFS